MKKIYFAFMLLSVGMAYGQVGVGITIGVPPPRRVEVVVSQPGPDYYWIEGYWYPVGEQYRWHSGYWSRPPYDGARWIGPRHDGHLYYEGYWEGGRGRIFHDHHWDNDRSRDFHHEGRGHR